MITDTSHGLGFPILVQDLSFMLNLSDESNILMDESFPVDVRALRIQILFDQYTQ